MYWNVTDEDACIGKDEAMRDDVHEQIQRLLDARDQKAFSQLLIDSVCSMPTDDFYRVREKLIKRFVDDQHRTTISSSNVFPGQTIANNTTITDKQPDGATSTEKSMLRDETASNDVNSSQLSLKIVNVRSCSVEESDRAWCHDIDSSSLAGNLMMKREQSDLDAVSVDNSDIEDVTTTNYITIAPIETTDVSKDDHMRMENRVDNETQCQHVHVTDTQPASTASHSQRRQV